MTKAAVKFLQAYIKEMMDLGGQNLPKAISSELGAKLGQMYQKKDILNFEKGLKKMYKVLNGKPKILKIDDKTYDITINYKRNFCPIGGHHNPQFAKQFQDSVCTPYTIGFLNSYDASKKYKGEIEKCIISSGNCYCKYILHMEEKLQ